MKPEHIVQLVARLFAVYLMVGFVVPEIVLLLLPSGRPLGMPLLEIFLIGAVTVSLWFYPWVLSIGILPKENKNKTTSPVTLEAVQTLCFALLGIYFCVGAIVPILQVAITEWISNGKIAWDQFWVRGIVEFLLGLWVMFGGRGLMGFITRLRNTPRQDPLE